MTDVRAHLSFLSVSAQKVRLVVDLVRGKNANDALETLRFVPSHAAEPVLKLLKSAVANAEENFGVSRDDLFIATIYADEAPRASGAVLAPAVASSRYCAVLRM